MHLPWLLLLLLLLWGREGSASSFHGFRAVSIPQDYWQPLPPGGSDEAGLLGVKDGCALACVRRGDGCMGFEVHAGGGGGDGDGDACTLGAVVPTWNNNYVAEYIMGGRRVFLKSERVARKAVTGVAHVASIMADDAVSEPLEDDRFQETKEKNHSCMQISLL